MIGTFNSIRNRVLIGATLIVAILLIALAALARQYAIRAADEAYDRTLSAAAISIADNFQLDEGLVTVDVPRAAFEMLGASRVTRVFYRIASPTGAFLTGYYDLANTLPDPQSGAVTIRDLEYRGETVRIASLGRYLAMADFANWAVVHLAETREARDALADELFRTILFPVLAASALTLALIWFGVSRAFKPFSLLRNRLAARTPGDLTLLDGQYPREVAPLISALNDFMARLGVSLATMRQLVADAAHQLRTPIAALRAQAEVARDETDPAVLRERIRRIHANAIFLSRLQAKLLTSASISHRLGLMHARPVDLRDVIGDVVDRLDDPILSRIELLPIGTDLPTIVSGERIALQEMLRNLVENAAIYAHKGSIEISLRPGQKSGIVTLSVADHGPGIPAGEREQVLKRFQRGSNVGDQPGSGLGLSIAHDVALASGGSLVLAETPGGGLTAEVELPLVAPIRKRSWRSRLRGFVLPISAITTAMLGAPEPSAQTSHFPAPQAGPTARTLTLASDGEHSLFRTMIEAFQERFPTVAVEYRALPAGLVNQQVVTGPVSQTGPDLAISIAIDLQVKLVNDGYAYRSRHPDLRKGPPWSRWRDELFAFTMEPLMIAYGPAAPPPSDRPRTRLRLAQMLETGREANRDRVVIYDITRSGVGYLYSAYDAGLSPLAWRLARAFGDVEARIVETEEEMLAALEEGRASLAFGIAGTASVRQRAEASGVSLVPMEDYSIVAMRTALIPKAARNPALAELFLDFLLSEDAQARLGESALLRPGRPQPEHGSVPVSIIPLGAASLIHSDQRKRGRFLDTWIQLVLKP